MNITKEMLKKNVVFHCDTEEKASEFCEKLNRLGHKWCDDESYLDNNNYSDYKENTCYYVYYEEYCYIDFYKERDYKIIEYKLDDTPNIEKAILNGNLFESLTQYDFYKNIEFEEMKALARELVYMLEKKDKGMSNREKEELLENLGYNDEK